MSIPRVRSQRLRFNRVLRDLVAEVSISPSNLISPMFVKEDLDEPAPIRSMPGVFQHTPVSVQAHVKELLSAGVRAIILFGIPTHKDAQGSEASNPSGFLHRTVREVKDVFGDDVLVVTDLCLDEYTDHGHCGILTGSGHIDNDATLQRYAEIAISQAEAGADLIAPSGMMDGQVEAIRNALDSAGRTMIPIMAYTAKFASAFYGPFRDAAECAPAFGDRRSYQMDFRNRREAVREAILDDMEGADVIMVKPAGHYLDIISDLREATDLPVAAFQVSGEYSMLRAGADAGYFALDVAMEETLIAIKRAGATLIITYFALEAARLFR